MTAVVSYASSEALIMHIFTLTKTQFEAKRLKLQGIGVNVPDSLTGEITSHGVTVRYTYVEPTLTISVTNYGGNPHFFVDHTIRGWFQS